jgi:acyl carrier protein
MVDNELKAVVAKVFLLDPGQISDDLGVGSIKKWDSLGQLRLMLAVEERFGVKFDVSEVIGLDTVSKIAKALGEKAAS